MKWKIYFLFLLVKLSSVGKNCNTIKIGSSKRILYFQNGVSFKTLKIQWEAFDGTEKGRLDAIRGESMVQPSDVKQFFSERGVSMEQVKIFKKNKV